MIYFLLFAFVIVVAFLNSDKYEPRRWPEIWKRVKENR